VRSLVVALVIAGCTKDRPEPQPRPVPADAAPGPRDATPLDAPPIDAPIDAPGPEAYRGARMLGPFAASEQVCATVACPAHDARLECSAEPDHDDHGTVMAAPPAPFTDVHLQAINCRHEGSRDGTRNFHAVVKRGDGYWVTPPLFSIGGNDKYCAGALAATWARRDLTPAATELVLAATGTTTCLTCGKRGNGDQTLDMLVGLADTPQGPVYWKPIVIGQHRAQRPDDDYPVGEPGYEPCPAEQADVVLRPKWTPQRLELVGPSHWGNLLERPEDGQLMWLDDSKSQPSGAGTHAFALP
jgi:hypothetical protein